MWFVSASESPIVATTGAPLPPVTSATAPSADVSDTAISRARIIGSESSTTPKSVGLRAGGSLSVSLSVCANVASRSS